MRWSGLGFLGLNLLLVGCSSQGVGFSTSGAAAGLDLVTEGGSSYVEQAVALKSFAVVPKNRAIQVVWTDATTRITVKYSTDPLCDWSTVTTCENGGQVLTPPTGIYTLAASKTPGAAPLLLDIPYYFVAVLQSTQLAAQSAKAYSASLDRPVWATLTTGTTAYYGGEFTGFRPYTGGGAVFQLSSGALSGLLPIIEQKNTSGGNMQGYVYESLPDGVGGWYFGGKFTAAAGRAFINFAHQDNFGHITANQVAKLPTPPNYPDNVPQVKALAQAGNFIYVGSYSNNNFHSLFAFQKNNPNNWLTLPLVTGTVLDLAVDTSSASPVLYLVGEWVSVDGSASDSLFAFIQNSDGTLVPSAWNPWGVGGNPFARIDAVVVDAQYVYVSGYRSTCGDLFMVGCSDGLVVALPKVDSTTMDPIWTVQANYMEDGYTSWAQSLALGRSDSSKDILYVGGTFTQVTDASGTTSPAKNLFALNKNTGAFIPTWQPSTDHPVLSLQEYQGAVYLGGQFAHVNNTDRSHLAAVDATTGALQPWNPGTSSTVQHVNIPTTGGTLFAGGTFDYAGGENRNYLASFDVVSGQLNTWDPSPDEPVFAFANDGTALYAAGEFTQVGRANARPYVAAFDLASGNLLPLTLSALDCAPKVLLASGGSLYAGCGVQNHQNLQAFDTTSGQVLWAAEAFDGEVNALSSVGGRLYVGGAFTTVGRVDFPYLASFDPTVGSLYTDWTPQPDGAVRALAASNDLLFIGGDFTRLQGQARTRLASFGTDGQMTTWAPAINDSVLTLAHDPTNQRLYVGGRFTQAGTGSSGLVDRLNVASYDLTFLTLQDWAPQTQSSGIQSLSLVGSSVVVGGYTLYDTTLVGVQYSKGYVGVFGVL